MQKGKCPLSLAAASGLADVVDLLLTKGINIDEIDRASFRHLTDWL